MLLNENIIRIIEVAAVAIGTLLAKTGVDYFNSRKKSDRVDFSTILKELRTEVGILKEERKELTEINKILQKRVLELELEVRELRNKILLLESAHNNSPLPTWLKDTDGTMLALNQACEELFLKPNGIKIENYIGSTDYAVWPKEIAREYEKNDLFVLRTKEDFVGTETVLINGEKTQWRIIKYIRYIGNLPIGVAGKAIPDDFSVLKKYRS